MALPTTDIGLKSIVGAFSTMSSNSPVSFSNLYGKTAGIVVSGEMSIGSFRSKRNLSPTFTTAATQLGTPVLSPWNASYADNTAQYIWNDVNATSATAGGYVTFQRTYYNNTNTSIAAVCYGASDNSAVFYLNKSLIHPNMDGWPSVIASNCTLLSGSNLLEFVAYNAPFGGGSGANPACLYYYVRNSSNNTILRSDNTTVCSTTVGTQPTIS